MSEVTVITNNVPRFVVEAYELSADERADFDYLDWTAIEAGEDSATFVRYKGELLDIGEFTVWTSLDNPFPEWQGYRCTVPHSQGAPMREHRRTVPR